MRILLVIAAAVLTLVVMVACGGVETSSPGSRVVETVIVEKAAYYGDERGEGVSQAMGTYPASLACLRIHKFWQDGTLRTFSHNLPASASTDAEDDHLAFSGYRPATLDVVPEHL